MKFKYIIPLLAVAISLSSAYAAQELSPEQAKKLEPFQKITLKSNFFSLDSANKAVSHKADQLKADFFYIDNIDYYGSGGRWIVSANLYKKDAKLADNRPSFHNYHGVLEYDKTTAHSVEAYDTVTVTGYYAIQPDAISAIAKAAKEKGAYAFFIAQQRYLNNNDNGLQEITALVFKKDAPLRKLQRENAIPANSETAKKLIAKGETEDVEIQDAVATTSLSRVGFFGGTDKSTPSISKTRYSVTLPDGTKIEELNNETALKMEPFKTIRIRGYFATFTDISYAIAKKAASEGAKYYHISGPYEEKGGNYQVEAELFK